VLGQQHAETTQLRSTKYASLNDIRCHFIKQGVINHQQHGLLTWLISSVIFGTEMMHLTVNTPEPLLAYN